MSFEIRPIPGASFGAEVVGFSLPASGGAGFSESDRTRLNRAWVDSAVLCFRDQSLSPGGFLRLAGVFGTPARQPIQRREYQVEGYPELRVLSSRHVDTYGDGKPLLIGGSWHTDHSHLPEPPWGTVLRALELPSRGGDTSFTNLTGAYAALDARARAEVDPLVGVHVYLSKYSKRRLQAMTPEELARAPSARHPLVRRHDVTGRPGLYFNPIRIERFEGMTEADSQALLARLVAHCEREEHVYRHRWRTGDVLIWDNRQTMHMVRHDYPPEEHRLMHRTLVGSPELAAAMAEGEGA